jgi:hypothetical protein
MTTRDPNADETARHMEIAAHGLEDPAPDNPWRQLLIGLGWLPPVPPAEMTDDGWAMKRAMQIAPCVGCDRASGGGMILHFADCPASHWERIALALMGAAGEAGKIAEAAARLNSKVVGINAEGAAALREGDPRVAEIVRAWEYLRATLPGGGES